MPVARSTADPSAGVHGFAAHSTKIRERQDHDFRRRAAGRKMVESAHHRGRVRHSGVGRIGLGADRDERDAGKNHDRNSLWST